MRVTKTILSTLCLLLVSVSSAQAVTCANGVYRAGCVGPNGAAVVHKPVPPRAVVVTPKPVVVAPRPVVVVPAPRCAWVNGHKVCR